MLGLIKEKQVTKYYLDLNFIEDLLQEYVTLLLESRDITLDIDFGWKLEDEEDEYLKITYYVENRCDDVDYIGYTKDGHSNLENLSKELKAFAIQLVEIINEET